HGEQRRRHGGHARGEGEAGLGSLEHRALPLEHLLGRVAVAAVLLALGLATHVPGELGGVAGGLRRGLGGGGADRGGTGRARLAAVDRFGRDAAPPARGSLGIPHRAASDVRFSPFRSMHLWIVSRTTAGSFGSSMGRFAKWGWTSPRRPW